MSVINDVMCPGTVRDSQVTVIRRHIQGCGRTENLQVNPPVVCGELSGIDIKMISPVIPKDVIKQNRVAESFGTQR